MARSGNGFATLGPWWIRGVGFRHARELFAKRELFVAHGALERLPKFMFEGPLASVDALCRDYVGSVEVAQGTPEGGVQLGAARAQPRCCKRA
jgi:hypothetical protein